MLTTSITASMLYNLTSCEHRLYLDTFGDPSKRGEPNAFIQLLWEKGTILEKEVMTALDLPFLDLSSYRGEDKECRTREAIEQGLPLIYGGRLSVDHLLGEPDLLRKEGTGYVAGDIKSGSGEEGEDDHAKLKKSYAVQLGLYTDILERLKYSPGRWGFIWDIHGKEVHYDFSQPQSSRTPQTWWKLYESFRQRAQDILEQQHTTQAAYSSGTCKLCVWYQPCLLDLQKRYDLTLLPELGRAKRDALNPHFSTIQDFAVADLSSLASTSSPASGRSMAANPRTSRSASGSTLTSHAGATNGPKAEPTVPSASWATPKRTRHSHIPAASAALPALFGAGCVMERGSSLGSMSATPGLDAFRSRSHRLPTGFTSAKRSPTTAARGSLSTSLTIYESPDSTDRRRVA
jgi:predicted RecB family nuclease